MDEELYPNPEMNKMLEENNKINIVTVARLGKEKGVERFGLHAFLVSNTVSNDYYPMLAKVLLPIPSGP